MIGFLLLARRGRIRIWCKQRELLLLHLLLLLDLDHRLLLRSSQIAWLRTCHHAFVALLLRIVCLGLRFRRGVLCVTNTRVVDLPRRVELLKIDHLSSVDEH